MNISLKIEGLQQLQTKIKNIRPVVEGILSGEIEAAAENIERMAKENAPSVIKTANEQQQEYGEIRNSLSAWKVSELEWQAGIQGTGPINDRAGYLEWGTGKYINIPPGLEAYAMMWYKTGRGTILPHPYLFPAVEQERIKLIERLKQDLNNL